MKYTLLMFSLLLSLVACNNSTNNEFDKPIEIIPVYNLEKTDGELVQSVIESTNTAARSKVTLDPKDTVINIIDTNLDLDSNDEQIIIVKDNIETGSFLRVLVADYDNIMNSYSVSWEGITSTNNIRSFSITLKDITGDHNIELICSGIDFDGKETLNIFRRTPLQGGIIIHFSEILNLVVDGSIEIREEKRSQSYTTGISNGISFPVIVSVTDPESDNLLDITQETYLWRNQESVYKLINIENIPGDEIENEKLRELYRGNKQFFSEFLSGPWMLSSSHDALSYNNPLVYFDIENEQVVFFHSDYQEIYIWESTSKTLSNTLQISCTNELVPFLNVTLSAKVLDLNNISIRFKDNSIRNNRNTENDIWTGKYFKLNSEIQKKIINDFQDNTNGSSIPVLSGYYTSDTGDEIYFNTPNYTLKTDNSTVSGGYYLFDNGLKIAEFKVLDKNNIARETLSYKYDYFETNSEVEIIRTIILIPGDLTIKGFVPKGEQFIRFVQVEQIEREETEQVDQ
jgi:hypothetical protein